MLLRPQTTPNQPLPYYLITLWSLPIPMLCASRSYIIWFCCRYDRNRSMKRCRRGYFGELKNWKIKKLKKIEKKKIKKNKKRREIWVTFVWIVFYSLFYFYLFGLGWFYGLIFKSLLFRFLDVLCIRSSSYLVGNLYSSSSSIHKVSSGLEV
jgi:hypothetical protein